MTKENKIGFKLKKIYILLNNKKRKAKSEKQKAKSEMKIYRSEGDDDTSGGGDGRSLRTLKLPREFHKKVASHELIYN